MTMIATRCTRRKLTIENSHDLHRNPYHTADNILMAMQWANEHHVICERCRQRVERRNRPDALARQVAKRRAKMEEAGEW